MVFSGLTISSVSFDFEIFSDNTRPLLGNCGGLRPRCSAAPRRKPIAWRCEAVATRGTTAKGAR
jgi:hypothetical protein